MAGYIHKRGSSDNGNPTGVAREREELRGRVLTATGEGKARVIGMLGRRQVT